MTENNNRQQNEVQMISKDDGVSAHYWDGHLYPIFIFPKKSYSFEIMVKLAFTRYSSKIFHIQIIKS